MIVLTFIVILILIAVFISSVMSLVLWGGISLLNNIVEDWELSEEVWHEVEIPISPYDGKVVFMAQAAHPILSEYYYKLQISQGDQVKEIDLPMNTGGQIREPLYLITYEDEVFLETGDVVIDFKTIDAVDSSSESGNPEHDDVEYYNIRIKGDKTAIGEVIWANGLTFSAPIDLGSLYEHEEITWDDWVDLSSSKGKLRIVVGKDDSLPYLDSYIEISNNKESAIFEVSNAFDRYEFTVRE